MIENLRFVSPLERLLCLKRIAAMKGLGSAELAVLAQNARERMFRKGEVLLKAGETVGSFFIVAEGRVRVEEAGLAPKILEAGEPVGLFHLLSRCESLEVVADDDCVTLEISADIFFDVLEDNFTMYHNLVQVMARTTLSARRQIPNGTYLAPREGKERVTRDIDLVERLVILGQSQVFNKTSMDGLVQIASSVQEFHFAPGTHLWREGDASGFIYSLVSGTVRCSMDEGRHFFRCGPGYPLGNLESQARAPRWYDAVTETPVVGLRGETEHFLDVLEDHFEMAMDFLSALAAGYLRIVAESNERLAESA